MKSPNDTSTSGEVGAARAAEGEPWLRGTLLHVPPVPRALLHSLEMAEEDAERWCRGLSSIEIHARPFQLPSVAFHLRHIARSLDRFFTYAAGRPLNGEQRAGLATEMDPPTRAGESTEAIFSEFMAGLEGARKRLLEGWAEMPDMPVSLPLDQSVAIGRKALPTTWGGLMVHAAEHTQRHIGQAITTAKVVLAQRNASR